MASLLVFSRSSNSQLTEAERCGQPERGDPVDVHDDDMFHWGDAIMGPGALGWWQVIVIPGVPAAELRHLLQGSEGAREMGFLAWRHRIWSVNLDTLAQGQAAGLTWVVQLPVLLAACTLKHQANITALLGGAIKVG